MSISEDQTGCCINKHAHMARPHLRGYMYVFVWKEFSPGSNEIFTNRSPCGWIEPDIWSLFHCLAPLPSPFALWCRARDLNPGVHRSPDTGGLPSSQVALVVHVSNQLESKKADVSPNPGEVLRAAFRGWRGAKAHPKLSAMSLSWAKIAIILFFISSFWLKCSSTPPTPQPPWHKTVCDILSPFHNRWPPLCPDQWAANKSITWLPLNTRFLARLRSNNLLRQMVRTCAINYSFSTAVYS